MIPNSSPWIQQLKRTRPVRPLDRDVETDVAIVGGGIAGVTTAFFALRETSKRVVLVEADKVAHGASGHNAGQVTSYFERPLHELAERFGLEAAVAAQRGVESAWALIDGIISASSLRTPLYRFIGHAGLSSLEQLTEHLKNNAVRKRGGLETEEILVSESWEDRALIPQEFAGLFRVAPSSEILARLETGNPQYVASISYRKGCMNSALFSEEVVGWLLATYPERFSLYEGTPIRTVRLRKGSARLETGSHAIAAGRVVLCTNGFENFSIVNEAGRDIDASFHHSVTGRIGYMAGYFAPPGDAPTAISYFQAPEGGPADPVGESYFYLTRRPHEHESGSSHTLVCTGGPEAMLPNGADYSRTQACFEDPRIAIDDFLSANYGKHPGTEPEYAFCWHGLMGYTPEGVRLVGPEPLNPTLLYNLGCNGVGILPSVFGSRRIARFLNGEPVEPSIFDPRDQSASVEDARKPAPRSPNGGFADAVLFAMVGFTTLTGASLWPYLRKTIVDHGTPGLEFQARLMDLEVFLLPAIMAVLLLVKSALPAMDPFRKNVEGFREAFDAFWIALFAFLTYAFGLALAENLGFPPDISLALPPALAALLYALGHLLPQTRRNWFMGIRTPWTLSSDAVWAQTHAVGGRLFKIAAVFPLLSMLLRGTPAFLPSLLAPILLVAATTIAYSYAAFRKEQEG